MGRHRAVLTGAVAPQKRPRASWKANRVVLNGILWILRTGAPMGKPAGMLRVVPDLPSAVSTMGSVRVLKDILSVVAEALHDESYLDLQEAFIDGGFAPAKKGGRCVGKTKRGKGSKIIAI